MKVALLSCTSRKKNYPCRASEMYSESSRFRLAYQYAKKTSDKIYILSAKYGLISEYEVIKPYNEALKDKSSKERLLWSNNVILSMKNEFLLDSDEFTIIAGKIYYENLIPYFSKYKIPLKSERIGNWIPKLNLMIENNQYAEEDNYCKEIHELFNNANRLYHYDITQIPFENGIYVMFERGEKYGYFDRIVRIGTHRSDGRLKNRLKDHFQKENKDGSIFRKNIGLALLHKNKNPYEDIWSLDESKADTRTKFLDAINSENKLSIEKEVTNYLHNNISFVCFEVETKEKRLRIEEGLISLLNNTNDFYSSDSWLGKHSPKLEIAQSGLWNTQGLNARQLSNSEITDLKNMLDGEFDKSLNNVPVSIDRTNETTENKNLKTSLKNNASKGLTLSIVSYIKDIMAQSKIKGYKYIDIISGDIHKEMKLVNKMPSVCSAMYKLRTDKDMILNTTPSGKSSTIKIRYYL